LYRQLEAARAERNIWPIGENGKTGTIPERQLRPLNAVFFGQAIGSGYWVILSLLNYTPTCPGCVRKRVHVISKGEIGWIWIIYYW
jgi:hypothetical protein